MYPVFICFKQHPNFIWSMVVKKTENLNIFCFLPLTVPLLSSLCVFVSLPRLRPGVEHLVLYFTDSAWYGSFPSSSFTPSSSVSYTSFHPFVHVHPISQTQVSLFETAEFKYAVVSGLFGLFLCYTDESCSQWRALEVAAGEEFPPPLPERRTGLRCPDRAEVSDEHADLRADDEPRHQRLRSAPGILPRASAD